LFPIKIDFGLETSKSSSAGNSYVQNSSHLAGLQLMLFELPFHTSIAYQHYGLSGRLPVPDGLKNHFIIAFTILANCSSKIFFCPGLLNSTCQSRHSF